MKRIRKCCCGCLSGDEIIVATFPETVGMWNLTYQWDLTPYQSKTFKKYKGRYWDVRQGTDIRARGKVGKDGTMADLPDSVSLQNLWASNIVGAAELRVRCHAVCGDPDYFGEALGDNAGIEGEWDLTEYKNKKYPQCANGFWRIRQYPGENVYSSGSISAEGELVSLPDNVFPVIDASDPLQAVYFCDLAIICPNVWNVCNIPPSAKSLSWPSRKGGFLIE